MAKDSPSAESRMGQRREAAKNEGSASYLAKRDELIRTAAALFKEKGYEATSLNDIAECLNTDRASLYYYISSKEDLLKEAMRGIADEILATWEAILRRKESPRERLTAIIQQILDSYEKNLPYVYVYMREDMTRIAGQDTAWANEIAEQIQRLQKILTTIIDAGKKDGSFRTDIPTSLALNGLFGMLYWTHRWFNPKKGDTSSEVAIAFTAIFFDGFALAPKESRGARQGAGSSRAKGRRRQGEVPSTR